MSTLDKKIRRDVVPRWRLSTSSRADLDSLPANPVKRSVVGGVSRPVENILDEFDVTQKPMIAAEALSMAISEGESATAIEAAKRLTKFDLRSRPALASLVERVLREDSGKAAQDVALNLVDANEKSRNLIRKYKKLVRAYPKSALAWLDLAFAYAGIGQNERAKTAVSAANALERDHRGVVRACSRFFVHSGEFDRALWTISRSEQFKEDPWLLSAHIATSRAAGIKSPFLSIGRKKFKEKKWRNDQISELGAAIATNELESGNLKLAHKYVERSLLRPTENAVAQVTWLETIGDTDFKASVLASEIPAAWEARTFEEYEKKNWRKSCEEAACWFLDQPFSSRPAVHGSFVAATFLEDYELALRFSEAGFRANPTDEIIVNNYTVSLAEVGRVKEARTIFDNHMSNLSADAAPTSRATDGLILYREGSLDEARVAYSEAINHFKSRKDFRSELLASIYQAREEIRIENYEGARDLFVPLINSTHVEKSTDVDELKLIVDRLNSMVSSNGGENRV